MSSISPAALPLVAGAAVPSVAGAAVPLSAGAPGPAPAPATSPGDRPSSAFSLALLALSSGVAAHGGVGVGGGVSLGDFSVTGGRGRPVASFPHGSRDLTAGATEEGGDEGGESGVDGVSRHAAQLAPPLAHPAPLLEAAAALSGSAPAAGATPAGFVPSSLGDLIPGLVRRVAWSGDARRGALRLELGSGSLAGASVVVKSEGGRVDVTLVAPAEGAAAGGPSRGDLESWRDRIAARLEARGIDVGAVEVGG